MKKQIIIILGILLLFSTNSNSKDKINIGIIFGFSGSVETLTPSMAEAIEIPFKEISSGKNYFENVKFELHRIDSTCSNFDEAQKSFKRLKKNISFIIGGACPGVSELILKKFAIPKKIIMITPADTSFGLSNLNNQNLFFRTIPLSTRSGEVLADFTKDKGIKNVAVFFANNENNKNLAKKYTDALKRKGISVSLQKKFEEDKKDFSDDISSLVAAGGDALATFAEYNKGGREILKSLVDSGAFKKFIFSQEMITDDLLKTFNKNLKESFGLLYGSQEKGVKIFESLAKKNNLDPESPFVGESYDAASLIILATKDAGSLNPNSIYKSLLSVANKPGTKIYPGEIVKGLEILDKGKPINYEGVTNIEFSNKGETYGSFLEIEFRGNELKVGKQR